jgi:hypothetical protein
VPGQTNTGNADIVVFKLGADGTVQWVHQQPFFNTIESDYLPSIALDISGHIFITYTTNFGVVSGQTHQGGNIVVFKLDNNGNTLWITQDLAFSNHNGGYSTIATDSAGNCVVAYVTIDASSGQTLTGMFDIVVFKLNTAGQLLWVTQHPSFNTPDQNIDPAVTFDAQGQCLVTYQVYDVETNQAVINVFQLSQSGQFVQLISLPIEDVEQQWSIRSRIVCNTMGEIFVTYSSTGAVSGQTNTGGFDVVVHKLTNSSPTLRLSNYEARPSQNPMHARDCVTYIYQIQNTGNVPLTNLRVNDTRVTQIQLATTNLAPNQSTTGRGQVCVSQQEINQGQVVSQAIVTASYGTQSVTTQTMVSDLRLLRVPTLVTKRKHKKVLVVKNKGNVSLHNIVIKGGHHHEHHITELTPGQKVKVVWKHKFDLSKFSTSFQ